MRNKENNKGVTLVALVVTIIVLLILAGISIGMLTGNNGMITKAQTAKAETEKRQEFEDIQLAVLTSQRNSKGTITKGILENELNEIRPQIKEIVKSADDKLPWIVTGASGQEYQITEDGDVISKDESIEEEQVELKVGDYINYTPDEASAYTSLTADNTGYSSNPTSIKKETLNWQILRIYEDGSMDLVGSPTQETIYFNRALGYNNGVYLLNDICEKLYSKGKIKARSIKAEDIEKWLTAEGKKIKNSYVSKEGITVGKTDTYPTKDSLYPELYAEENGSGINTTDVKTDGINMSDLAPKDTTNFSIPTTKTTKTAESGLTVTQTFWRCDLDETNFGEGAKVLYSKNEYWVASRCVGCYEENYAAFFIRSADRVYAVGPTMMESGMGDRSAAAETGYPLSIRPVVTISGDTKIKKSKTASEDSKTPHEIIEY